MRAAPWLVGLVVVASAGAAFAGLQVGLEYDFEPGATSRSAISAEIETVRMGSGVPLAITGSAESEVTLELLSVDDDGAAELRVTFEPVTSTLMGQAQDPATPEPMVLRVDRHGTLLEASGGTSDVDLFASGGVPIQLIVLMAGVPELPRDPAEVAEGWVIEREQSVPDLGLVSARAGSTLEAIDGTCATILTDLEASFPDFAAKNPLQQGEVTVRNGLLKIEGMERVIDVTSGLTTSVEATMQFDCMAAVGGYGELPLTVVSSFAMTPPGEQPAAGEPEAAGDEGEAAGDEGNGGQGETPADGGEGDGDDGADQARRGPAADAAFRRGVLAAARWLERSIEAVGGWLGGP